MHCGKLFYDSQLVTLGCFDSSHVTLCMDVMLYQHLIVNKDIDVCIRPALTTYDINVQGLVSCTVVTCIDAKIDIVKAIESETLSI